MYNFNLTFTLVFVRPGGVKCGREAGRGGRQLIDIASYKPPILPGLQNSKDRLILR